jgi:hypothetical protein
MCHVLLILDVVIAKYAVCPRIGFTRGKKNILDFTQKLQRNDIFCLF